MNERPYKNSHSTNIYCFTAVRLLFFSPQGSIRSIYGSLGARNFDVSKYVTWAGYTNQELEIAATYKQSPLSVNRSTGISLEHDMICAIDVDEHY